MNRKAIAPVVRRVQLSIRDILRTFRSSGIYSSSAPSSGQTDLQFWLLTGKRKEALLSGFMVERLKALLPFRARCQMRVSSLSARWFGFFLLLIAGTIGCAQPGTGVSPSLTAPNLASGATDAKPSVSYDASGVWNLTATATNLNTGEEQTFESPVTFTQDPDGTIHASDDITVFTMTRKGSAGKLQYAMTVTEDHPDCDTNLSGTAQIDPNTNTLTAKLTGPNSDGQGCFRAQVLITATKN